MTAVLDGLVIWQANSPERLLSPLVCDALCTIAIIGIASLWPNATFVAMGTSARARAQRPLVISHDEDTTMISASPVVTRATTRRMARGALD